MARQTTSEDPVKFLEFYNSIFIKNRKIEGVYNKPPSIFGVSGDVLFVIVLE